MKLDEIIRNIPSLSPDAVAVNYRASNDEPARIVWVNDALCRLFGYAGTDIVGQRSNLLFHQGYRDDFDQTVFETLGQGRNSFSVDNLCVKADETEFWGSVSYVAIHDADGPGRHSVSTVRDIDDIKMREQAAEIALIENEQLLSAVEAAQTRLISAINMVPDPFMIFDANDRLLVWNPAFAEQVVIDGKPLTKGMPRVEIVRRAADSGLLDIDPGQEEDWISAHLLEWDTVENATSLMRIADRDYKVMRSRAPNGDRVVLRVDISDYLRQQEALESYAAQLECANQEISHQVQHDELTGLGNRRFLEDKLNELAEDRAINGGEIAALHIDLDRFKQINDTMGHAAGDHVLVRVAGILRKCLRKEDVIARIGGDEFVVLMKCSQDSDEPESLSDRLVAEIKRPIAYEDRLCRVGASIGIARTPVIDPHELVTSADVAMYKAKEAGKSRKAVFDHRDLDELRRTKQLADDILRGLDKSEFVPVYQPQVDALTERLIGYEVLARWQHPEHGLLAPDYFLRTAYDIQVVGQIDTMIFRRAMSECLNVFRSEKNPPSLSFNVGLQRVMDPDLLEDVKRQRYPGRIALELLETIFLEEESDEFVARLSALRDIGLSFEVDDFGSGRASIVGLRRIAPERLKIDRRLIQPIASSESARKLAQSIIDIGKALDIAVTAEGVESAEHAQILRNLQCDVLQGYHFGKPDRLENLMQGSPHVTSKTGTTG